MLQKVKDYPALLQSCWQEHLSKRKPNASTVISTFAGCGGSSLGYSMAGFRELLAVEWDDNAVATFKLNFPDIPVYHGDIANLSVDECMRLAKVREGQLDILDGSPPCQGFSTAGKRNFSDDRNQLFREYVRLLRGLRPKVFVMENVSGMVKGKMKLIFADILRELKASGYKVSARLLNAMYFNVPQSRQRMIFIGVREDLGIAPSHPQAESKPITIAQALLGIKTNRFDSKGQFRVKIIDENSPMITLTKGNQHHLQAIAFDDRYARLWARIPIGGNASDVIGKGYNSCVKPNPLLPAPTLPKTQTGRGFATIAHWNEPRALTIDEAKLIASYPDDWQTIGGYSESWARIGNSVPPLFMRSIARHIRTDILDKMGNLNGANTETSHA